MPTPPLSDEKKKWMRLLKRSGMSNDEIARKIGVSRGTVSNFTNDITTERRHKRDIEIKEKVMAGWSERKISNTLRVHSDTVKRVISAMRAERDAPVAEDFVEATDESNLSPLPKSEAKDIPPFDIDKPGRYLVLSDVHIPSHDETTIRCAVDEARRQGVVGVILNGDILDCHELSRFDKDPQVTRYVEEIKLGQEFIVYLRERFRKANFYYKLGNHEARIQPYIWNRAPAFEGLDCLSIGSLLEAKKHGVEIIDDKRIIRLGKLHVLHGHEMRGGGGVQPARWLYLKARSVALCGHFHKSSEHHSRNVADKHEAAWSLGCACGLKPAYMPVNDWNHGFAIVEVDRDGGFVVQNKRILNGKVV